uniref:Uncharacterized protein n=1 Tax=Arundo donax TaxID=35708 RepID=A0A0A9BNW5_ARUDO
MAKIVISVLLFEALSSSTCLMHTLSTLVMSSDLRCFYIEFLVASDFFLPLCYMLRFDNSTY